MVTWYTCDIKVIDLVVNRNLPTVETPVRTLVDLCTISASFPIVSYVHVGV